MLLKNQRLKNSSNHVKKRARNEHFVSFLFRGLIIHIFYLMHFWRNWTIWKKINVSLHTVAHSGYLCSRLFFFFESYLKLNGLIKNWSKYNDDGYTYTYKLKREKHSFNYNGLIFNGSGENVWCEIVIYIAINGLFLVIYFLLSYK